MTPTPIMETVSVASVTLGTVPTASIASATSVTVPTPTANGGSCELVKHYGDSPDCEFNQPAIVMKYKF
jgi:hypothetical protein